jgi:hypothetical protein
MAIGHRCPQFPRRRGAITLKWFGGNGLDLGTNAAVQTASGRAPLTMNGGLIANPMQLAEVQLRASLVQTVCRRLGVGETSLPVSDGRTEQWFEADRRPPCSPRNLSRKLYISDNVCSSEWSQRELHVLFRWQPANLGTSLAQGGATKGKNPDFDGPTKQTASFFPPRGACWW